mgnify:FL=1
MTNCRGVTIASGMLIRWGRGEPQLRIVVGAGLVSYPNFLSLLVLDGRRTFTDNFDSAVIVQPEHGDEVLCA